MKCYSAYALGIIVCIGCMSKQAHAQDDSQLKTDFLKTLTNITQQHLSLENMSDTGLVVLKKTEDTTFMEWPKYKMDDVRIYYYNNAIVIRIYGIGNKFCINKNDLIEIFGKNYSTKTFMIMDGYTKDVHSIPYVIKYASSGKYNISINFTVIDNCLEYMNVGESK